MRNICAHRSLRLLLVVLLLYSAARAAHAQAQEGEAQGTIAGSVLDVTTADPVIDAGVELIGKNKTVRTDIDGKFSFKVPSGAYELRIFASGYQGARITKINVKPGQVTLADTTLAPEGEAGVQIVEVVAQADRAAEKTQILARQKADSVQDTISAEVIKKSPDSDAAEIVTRVPSVTVKDNYVFVRGLGERYSQAMLNGSRLPSPDPNKRVVPLDLFPTSFLASLAIIKTYTPDLPGDFAGGLVDISLITFPTEFQASIGFSLAGNTNSTFQEFETYPGNWSDYLGVDATRALPGIFGSKGPIQAQTPADQQHFASALRNVWTPNSKTAPPNTGFNFSIGDSWGPFGVAFATNWQNEYQILDNVVQREFVNGQNLENPQPVLVDNFLYDYSIFTTRLGGLLTAGYELGDTGRLTFRSFYNRASEDQVLLGSGTGSQTGLGTEQDVTRLQYTERDIAYGQLGGEHILPGGMQIDWRSAFAQTNQNVPDTRTTVYLKDLNDPSIPPLFTTNTGGSGLRVFFDIDEIMSDSAVDFTVPFTTWLPFTDVWSGMPAKFKFGPAYTYRDRNSNLRQFQYRPRGDLSLPPDELLDPIRIGSNQLMFSETTDPADSFEANQEIAGGYGMFDLPIVKDLVRLVAGVRTEYSYIKLKTFMQGVNEPVHTIINDTDPLPGINLIVTPTSDQNVRASYSQTVSRPEFRELSPIEYPEPAGLRPTVGNPNLVESHIDNYDLRWEWFFTPLELVSASFFYKSIEKPIETVLLSESSNVANSFANADSATLWGFEVEGRKNFGFVQRELEPLSVSLNVSYIASDVTPGPPVQFQAQTVANRPLQGQSPYIINAALEWVDPDYGTARFLYNTAGKRIVALGGFGLPNIEEQPRNQLDFVWFNTVEAFGEPFVLKFAAENLWNDHYLFTQGDAVQSRWRKGIKVGVSFTYNF